MYYMTVSYVIMSENRRTREWEPSDRHSYTVYGSTKEKVEEYADAEHEELKARYGKRNWYMDDEYEEMGEVPENERWLYEDGDVEER